MAIDSIIRSTADGIATITLNRPDVLNSFNSGMARELQATLTGLAGDDSVRAVLLTGAGRAFSAGQDLPEAPVVSAGSGTAAGGGPNLAFACDIVFAASDATFIQSFAKIGVIPDSGGTFILPRLVGLQRAAALTMLCEKVSAEQALAWGLIYKVCEPSALMETARATAKHLATQPTRALGLIKRGFNRSLGVDLEAQLAYEEELQREAGKSADYAEGVKAFLEKRKPNFTGR